MAKPPHAQSTKH